MNPGERERIRFYFSFRSPFAWFAAEQLEAKFGDLPVDFDLRPVYPGPDNFPNDPTAVPNKARYFVQDMLRNARYLGLDVQLPKDVDVDWQLSHAAATAAASTERGLAFALAVFRKRWSDGADVSQEDVIAEAARMAELDPKQILDEARDPDTWQGARDAWDRASEEDGVFGVPSFIVRDKLYWGQDRMDFARRAVERALA